MALLTVAQFREHSPTDLVGDAVQRFLDDAEKDIDKRFGALASQVDTSEGWVRSVFTTREIDTITSVKEVIDDLTTTLAADDYRRIGLRELRRLADGTNGRSRWGAEVVVDYVPVSDVKERTRVQIDLVKLAISYNATRVTRAGNDRRFDFVAYQAERESILSGLETLLLV